MIPLPPTAPARRPVPGRACGSCTLCCKVVGVAELAKPAGAWCRHCKPGRGCAVYDQRPQGCRDFHCEWMMSERLGPEWKPDRAKFAMIVTATGHLAACVDPGFPAAWRQPPYYAALRRWAVERAADPRSTWPAIEVWIGPRCILLLPDGEHDLGPVADDEEVRIDLVGGSYRATKFRVQRSAA